MQMKAYIGNSEGRKPVNRRRMNPSGIGHVVRTALVMSQPIGRG